MKRVCPTAPTPKRKAAASSKAPVSRELLGAATLDEAFDVLALVPTRGLAEREELKFVRNAMRRYGRKLVRVHVERSKAVPR